MSWDKNRTIASVQQLYKERANSDNPYHWDPEHRVTWTDVWELMRQHGYSGDVVGGRLAWHEATRGIKWSE